MEWILEIDEKKKLGIYFSSLINNVPHIVYMLLLVLFVIVALLLLVFKQSYLKKGISRLLIVEYCVILYFITVFSRKVNSVRKYDFEPFWSYEIPDLLLENVMNVVVFIPVGILLGLAFSNIKLWKVVIIGLLLSLPIELLQFLFKKGFAEIDDVIHNTVGCVVGYGLYSLFKGVFLKLWRRRVAHH